MEMNLDILHAIQDGEEKPTRIMSKSNLTWAQLQEGLVFLEESGFIQEKVIGSSRRQKIDKRTKNMYTLTEKGASVLRYFRKELAQVENLITSL